MAWRPALAATDRNLVAPVSFPVLRRLLLVYWLLLSPVLAAAESLQGIVIQVADGDTVTVLDSAYVQHKVRLSGIDAPEKKQAFGTRSKQHLMSLLQDKEVIVIWNKHDRYGRIIGKMLPAQCATNACPDTRDAGLAQVRAGLAWHSKQYQRDQEAGDRERYAVAEYAARLNHDGLWQDASPVPPWDYRRGARTALPMADGRRAGS
jgi:endonuclease YncB( thermonuclease family)